MALQSAGLPLLTMDAPAACCCGHKEAHCQCKVCSHAREIESSNPIIKTCGSGGAATVVVAADPAFPADLSVSLPEVVAVRSEMPLPRSPPDPAREVLTPPPLAQT